jgi:hypothetical protein
MNCPDSGWCHHECTTSCWRVGTCLPLGISGWDDWPDDVKAANPPVERFENVLLGHGTGHRLGCSDGRSGDVRPVPRRRGRLP